MCRTANKLNSIKKYIHIIKINMFYFFNKSMANLNISNLVIKKNAFDLFPHSLQTYF